MATYRVPPNSDYFPILDLNAPRSRFLANDATALTGLRSAPFPLAELLDGPLPPAVRGRPVGRPAQRRLARALLEALLERGEPPKSEASSDILSALTTVASGLALCPDREHASRWLTGVLGLSNHLIPFLLPGENARLFDHLASSACHPFLTPAERDWLALLRAITQRDMTALAGIGRRLIAGGPSELNAPRWGYLIAATMLGEIGRGRPGDARDLLEARQSTLQVRGNAEIYLRLLYAHALARS